MRTIRSGTPGIKEMWGEPEIMNHLKCDKEMARQILNEYHQSAGDRRYGPVDKALLLDYFERKQRDEREREARYQSDLANVESIGVLKEQVKTLKEQVVVLRESAASSSKDAQKARLVACISNAIAIASLIVSIIAVLLKLG